MRSLADASRRDLDVISARRYVEVSCRNNGHVAVLERTLLRALSELPPLDALREGAPRGTRLRDRLRAGGSANDLLGLVDEMWGASGLGGLLGELSCIKRRGGDGREVSRGEATSAGPGG